MEKASAIILAGGKNIRMGRNKALIQLASGKTILQNTLNILQDTFSQIIIVTNRKKPYLEFNVQTVEDLIKDTGPLGGIFTGLCYSTSYYNFVIGCDMPFPQIDLIKLLLEKCGDQDVVVPEIGGEVEPLFAVYSKNCLPLILNHLLQNDLKIRRVLGELRVKRVGEKEVDKVDPKHLSFFNINTEEDLKKAQVLMTEISSSIDPANLPY